MSHGGKIMAAGGGARATRTLLACWKDGMLLLELWSRVTGSSLCPGRVCRGVFCRHMILSLVVGFGIYTILRSVQTRNYAAGTRNRKPIA